MANKSNKLKFGLIAIVVVLVLGFGANFISNMNYSEGSRAGVVTKFSKKGILLKTWEGELSMGGVEQGGVARVWQFSVQDPAVVEKIESAMTNGDHVKLPYNQKLFGVPWRGGTTYFVQDVVSADKSPSSK